MPKKSLGQHFLSAPGVVDDIIKAGDIHKEELIIEIGPGKGVLTRALLQKGAQVIAYEKDDWLSKELKEIFSEELQNGQLTLENKDFLEIKLPEKDYKVIANIPYNITGLILRKLFSSSHLPKKVVLMMQKEVVDRIIARDGKESLIGISIKVYGKPRYIRTVKPGSFNPPPKVDSAVIAIDNISRDAFDCCSEEQFFSIVKKGFSERRKQLKNNLKEYENMAQILNICNIPKNIRAEDMDIDQWLCLSSTILQNQE